MDVNVAVNTKGMEAACLALAKVTGKSIEEVANAEVAKVLDKAIDYTKSASRASIVKNYNASGYTSQNPTLYTPVTSAGSKWRAKARRTKNGKLIYNLNNRYPLALWLAIQKSRAKSLKAKIGAIGYAKKSWWIIGIKLGLPVKGGRFTKAVPQTGVEYPGDFTISRKNTSDGLEISFTNAQPTVNLVNGKDALQKAINGRVQFFTTNVKKGVFDSMAQIARAYPGLHLTGGN
jgi:hypothetical protein